MLDLSATTSLIFPAVFGFDAIVIVNPGPTVPLKVGVAAARRQGQRAVPLPTARAASAVVFNVSPLLRL